MQNGLSFFAPEAVPAHLAFGLLVAAMLMRRLTLLRLLVLASAAVVVFAALLLAEHHVSLFWGAVLVLVTLAQLSLTWWDDRGARFDPEEQVLVDQHFADLRPTLTRRLLKSGSWETAPPDTVLTIEGQSSPALCYLHGGHASVTVGGFDVGKVRAGDLVGEMSVLTDEPATATVMLDVEARLWRIESETVRRLAWENQEIGRALEAAFFRMLRTRLMKRNAEDSLAKAHPYAAGRPALL